LRVLVADGFRRREFLGDFRLAVRKMRLSLGVVCMAVAAALVSEKSEHADMEPADAVA